MTCNGKVHGLLCPTWVCLCFQYCLQRFDILAPKCDNDSCYERVQEVALISYYATNHRSNPHFYYKDYHVLLLYLGSFSTCVLNN